DRYFRISVKKGNDYTPNGLVSTYLHAQLEVDDTIEASAPAGTFTLEDGDAPVAFISGGVGITPMVSMLEQLVDSKSERDVMFVHAAQNEAVHAFHNHVEELTKEIGATYIYGYANAKNEQGM